MIFRCATLFIILMAWACSQEATEPGMCKIDCSSAIVGSPDLEINPISPAEVNIGCPNPLIFSPTPGTRQYESQNVFAVESKVKFLARREKKSDVSNENEQFSSTPNITIEPSVSGMASTNSEYIKNPNYPGVLTSQELFCTDSCGTVQLELRHVCPFEGSNGSFIQIFSAGLASETIRYTLEVPQKKEDKEEGTDEEE